MPLFTRRRSSLLFLPLLLLLAVSCTEGPTSTAPPSLDGPDLGVAAAHVPGLGLESYVNFLVASGELTRGQGTALIRHLENARRQMDGEQTRAALAQMDALVEQVENYAEDGVLDPSQSQTLLELAATARGEVIPSGITWSTISNPAGTTRLWGVWGVDEDTFWVVGDGGLVLKTTDGGSTWTDQSPATFSFLHFRGIWSPDGQNIWIAASDRTLTTPSLRHPILYSADGGATWSLQHGTSVDRTFPGGTFAVQGFSATDIWAGGASAATLHYDGASWTQHHPAGLITLYTDVWGPAPGEVYAVGTAIVHTTDGGSSWTGALDVLNSSFQGVWGSGPADVYAVGRSLGGSSGIVAHNDGSGWTSEFEPSPPLLDVWGTGADDVFVVGASGAVYRRDATGWSREPQVTGANLWSVWIAPGPGGDIIAVGDGGRIVRGARP